MITKTKTKSPECFLLCGMVPATCQAKNGELVCYDITQFTLEKCQCKNVTALVWNTCIFLNIVSRWNFVEYFWNWKSPEGPLQLLEKRLILLLSLILLHVSAAVTAVAGGIEFSRCPSALFLLTRYLRKATWEFFHIMHTFHFNPGL